MNVFLLTDVEGIAGVDDIDFMDRTREKFKLARDYLTDSINLAVGACYDAGAEKVYYLDGHGGGGTVWPERVDGRAKKCTIGEWQELLQLGEIDCQIEIGCHARAGTIGGFLDHTLNSKQFFTVRVNGLEMSELSLHALLCSKYGVPVIACLGDTAACRQAEEYVPGIFTGAVKHAERRNQAVTREDADAILTDTIRRALADWKSVALYTLPEPLTVEIVYYRTDFCEDALSRSKSGAQRIDARTLRKTVDVLRRYEDLKI